MKDAMVVERADRSPAAVLRWSGTALIAGGVLMAVATLVHPSLETPATILAGEAKLVAAHSLYMASYLLILLGLPGLYAARLARTGRLGMIGFVVAFTGTTLLAVSGNFGFIAPVLARDAPGTIDALSHYPPVVGFNALAAVGFMAGFVILGIALARTATLPRMAGILVAVGAPAHLIGFALAQFVSPGLWLVAILGSVALGAGLAWAGYQMSFRPAAERPRRG
jgi:hypothetical protein